MGNTNEEFSKNNHLDMVKYLICNGTIVGASTIMAVTQYVAMTDKYVQLYEELYYFLFYILNNNALVKHILLKKNIYLE